jgi:hypothetical protein
MPRTEPGEKDKVDDPAPSDTDVGDIRAMRPSRSPTDVGPPGKHVPSADLLHFTQLNTVAPQTPEPPSDDHTVPADQAPAPVHIETGPDGRLVGSGLVFGVQAA